MIVLFLCACTSSYDTATKKQEDTEFEMTDYVVQFDYSYLMTFHSCDILVNDCGNPSEHTVHVAGSKDAYSWELLTEIPSFDSSVPDIIIRDEILYIFALPELRRLDLQTGEWLATVYPQILNQDGEQIIHVDPSLFIDDENNIVLFFMEAQEGLNPATCPLGNLNCSKYFLSATEISGSQGSVYSVDDGVRIEIQLSESQRIAADPDIFRGPNGYYQYVSRGQNIQAFFSPALRGTYQPLSTLDDGILTRGGGGVPAGHYSFEQELFFTFVTTNIDGMSDIRLAIHHSVDTPIDRDSFNTVISGAQLFSESHLVASPGFIALESNR
ncbi:MAG: hypothetical protein CL916_02605 [Deltaproteobacteria bacterium]|nr:hypothetical protein [Deltaproteobacteria bacterium]